MTLKNENMQIITGNERQGRKTSHGLNRLDAVGFNRTCTIVLEVFASSIFTVEERRTKFHIPATCFSQAGHHQLTQV